MFECVVFLPLPIQPQGQSAREPLSVEIARFSFDPGFHKGEQISVVDLNWDGQLFSFHAIVKDSKKQIRSTDNGSVVRLMVLVEMADKEQIPQMVEILKTLNPNRFENYPLMESE
jgi:hypothetical protein